MSTEMAVRPTREDLFCRYKLNIVSACLMAGISRATIYRWMKRGKVEWVVRANGTRLIYADTLIMEPPE